MVQGLHVSLCKNCSRYSRLDCLAVPFIKTLASLKAGVLIVYKVEKSCSKYVMVRNRILRVQCLLYSSTAACCHFLNKNDNKDTYDGTVEGKIF